MNLQKRIFRVLALSFAICFLHLTGVGDIGPNYFDNPLFRGANDTEFLAGAGDVGSFINTGKIDLVLDHGGEGSL